MDTFYIADTHFYHTNIIGYCDRPFHSTHHMNTTMIVNWNRVVKPGDIVIHLGDFGLANFDLLRGILSQLNGWKILVTGNHDRKTVTKLLQMGFIRVSKTPYTVEVIQDPPLLLSHRPAKQLKKGYVNLCGHVHGKWIVNDFSINVGVDVHNFRPISSKEINMMIPELRMGLTI